MVKTTKFLKKNKDKSLSVGGFFGIAGLLGIIGVLGFAAFTGAMPMGAAIGGIILPSILIMNVYRARQKNKKPLKDFQQNLRPSPFLERVNSRLRTIKASIGFNESSRLPKKAKKLENKLKPVPPKGPGL